MVGESTTREGDGLEAGARRRLPPSAPASRGCGLPPASSFGGDEESGFGRESVALGLDACEE